MQLSQWQLKGHSISPEPVQRTKNTNVKTVCWKGLLCPYHPAVPGSNPKHTISAFVVKFCTIFVSGLRKRSKINKRGRFWPIFKKLYVGDQHVGSWGKGSWAYSNLNKSHEGGSGELYIIWNNFTVLDYAPSLDLDLHFNRLNLISLIIPQAVSWPI